MEGHAAILRAVVSVTYYGQWPADSALILKAFSEGQWP
jgi:hypothetical protein